MKTSRENSNHTRPLAVLEILLRCPTDTLRFVETEQTVIELSHDVLCREEVIEHPLLAESLDVCTEDRSCIRAEFTRLVYRNQDVLEL